MGRRWVRDVVLFLSGQTVSLFGSSLVQYAILWHLTLTTKSGVVLMLASVFGFLPQAVISIFGGVLADRHNRKLLIIAADASIAAATLVLAVLLSRGDQSLWLIYAALAIRSVGAGVQGPAVAALLPQLAPTDRLMRINGINASIQSGTMLLAPAVAAWLYAVFALQAVLFVDVVTALIGIGLLVAIPVSRIQRDGPDIGYLDDLRGGLAYVRSHRVVRRVLAFFAILFFLVVPPSYLTPLMVARTFGGEVWKLTALELAFSVGMIVGGIVLAAWGGLRNRMTTMVATSVALGVLSIGLGLSPGLWTFLAIMLAVGIAVAFFSTTTQTLLQEQVEPEMQGRVFGVMGIVMALAMPAGMMVFGPLGDVMSIEALLIVSGGLAVAVGLAAGRRAPAAIAAD